MSSQLTIHHLKRSQSERVIWLCEELGIPYKLELYDRQPPAMLAPEELRKLHWAETAPIITDGEVTLAETNAIFEYILAKYGKGRLVLPPTDPNYADYVFWLHRTNGSIQPMLITEMFTRLKGDNQEDMLLKYSQTHIKRNFEAMERQLSKFPYLAGFQFTAADCITLFSLTTLRLFAPFSLEEYPSIVKYLARIGEREAYKRAMEKGDPGLVPVLGANAPEQTLF
uniref:glutathione transferase n=1 Tax=Blastobotrys adeninivorans TaxID=409370 RepID=A0A060T782_BLAAD